MILRFCAGLVVLFPVLLATTTAFAPPVPCFSGQFHRTFGATSLLTQSRRLSDQERRRKRDIIRGKFLKGRRTSFLSSGKKDDDDGQSKSGATSGGVESISKSFQEKVDSLKNSADLLAEKIPVPLVDLVNSLLTKVSSWKALFLSFTTGALIATAAIIYPIYTSVENLSQPVTLFETILGDLEQAYVDPVDTNKLFETGVSAMLRSLDPYTEFEGSEEAVAMNESIEGKYGGVGLVISGAPVSKTNEKSATSSNVPGLDSDGADKEKLAGVRVVTAFEGYAFDYGMRVGDKVVAVDDHTIAADNTVEDVRNLLRGDPGTPVTIAFERSGVDGVQSVTMPRSIVRLRDVKLASLVGDPKKGMGYIQLSGFSANAGPEMRQAISYLQQRTEAATGGERSLQGLVLDLRGNPGGLLTSAVDVASLMVPKGSDIVSARGRGFPGMLYRSRAEPILESNTKLAVLVNGDTASAAEIVAGAIQDLDVGVIVGADRSFGKGLVQNVEELPFDTALKFTVAKYYTPSGRCIQGITYKEGGGLNSADGKYVASKVADDEKQTYYTKAGRAVTDGGGIEADFKVQAPKASALEVTLLRSGMMNDFASDWCKNNQLKDKFSVTDEMYRDFQAFIDKKQKSGALDLDALYSRPIADLKQALKRSGYKGAEKELEHLSSSILRDLQGDFKKYRNDIKEDIAQSILARYLPESMLIERGIKSDVQVNAALNLIASQNDFNKLLAKGSSAERSGQGTDITVASKPEESSSIRASIQW